MNSLAFNNQNKTVIQNPLAKKKIAAERQLSLKEQLFTKIKENYICPNYYGKKVYSCLDCGDRYLYKSSYDFHINRSSLKINMFCRNCKCTLMFTNRCQMLSHIRSHVQSKNGNNIFNLADISTAPLSSIQLPELSEKIENSFDYCESRIPNFLNNSGISIGSLPVSVDSVIHKLNSYYDSMLPNHEKFPLNPTINLHKNNNSIPDIAMKDIEAIPKTAMKDIENVPKTHKLQESQVNNESDAVIETSEIQIDSEKDLTFAEEDKSGKVEESKCRNVNVEETNSGNVNVEETNSGNVNMVDDTIENGNKEKKLNSTIVIKSSGKGDRRRQCNFCETKFVAKGKQFTKEKILHFGKKSSNVYYCQHCFVFTDNKCYLSAHNTIHSKMSPFVCPECGWSSKCISLFYYHLLYSCYHFARCVAVKCPDKTCKLFIPQDFLVDHFSKEHTKSLFKCPKCPRACNDEMALKSHHIYEHKEPLSTDYNTFYQCANGCKCIFSKANIASHINKFHMLSVPKKEFKFCCPGCKKVCLNVTSLKGHIYNCSDFNKFEYNKFVSEGFSAITANKKRPSPETITPTETASTSSSEAIEKTCLNCCNSFTYFLSKTHNAVPSSCPRCKNDKSFVVTKQSSESEQNKKIPSSQYSAELLKNNQDSVTEFSALTVNEEDSLNDPLEEHNITLFEERCKTPNSDVLEVDPLNISNDSISQTTLLDANKTVKKKRKISQASRQSDSLKDDSHKCSKCAFSSKDKKEFEKHIVTHRDISTAYQCMECGSCFVVKSSLSSHLLIIHGISETEEYIKNNNCYDEEEIKALEQGMRHRPVLQIKNVKENQCSICLEQFENQIDHDKHFRVHGMAFLLLKQKRTSTSP